MALKGLYFQGCFFIFLLINKAFCCIIHIGVLYTYIDEYVLKNIQLELRHYIMSRKE